MKVSELTNEQLDYWVAKAQGWLEYEYEKGSGEVSINTLWFKEPRKYKDYGFDNTVSKLTYTPSTNWQQTGELIEKFISQIETEDGTKYSARTYDMSFLVDADTVQRAVCMAVIASVYGDEVDEIRDL